MRLKLPSRKYSIYKQKRSLGICEICHKYKICYEGREQIDIEENVSYWTCKKCMSNEQYEYYFL